MRQEVSKMIEYDTLRQIIIGFGGALSLIFVLSWYLFDTSILLFYIGVIIMFGIVFVPINERGGEND